MKQELEEFSTAVCDAINRSRDWQDVDYLVGEEIGYNGPWMDGSDKEIRTAIRMAIRGSCNKNVKEGCNEQLLDFIWNTLISKVEYISYRREWGPEPWPCKSVVRG